MDTLLLRIMRECRNNIRRPVYILEVRCQKWASPTTIDQRHHLTARSKLSVTLLRDSGAKT